MKGTKNNWEVSVEKLKMFLNYRYFEHIPSTMVPLVVINMSVYIYLYNNYI